MSKAMAKLAALTGMMVGLMGDTLPYGLNYNIKDNSPKTKSDLGVFIIKYKNTYYHKETDDKVEWLSKDKATKINSYTQAKELATKYGCKVVSIG